MLTFEEGHSGSRRLTGFAIALGVHAVLFWALMSGLAKEIVQVVQAPLEVALLEEPAPIVAPPEPPPPVQQVVKKPPPAKIPKPEVVRKPPPAPPERTIQQVEVAPPEPVKEVAPQPPQVTPPRAAPRHANTQPPYPSAARRANEEGRVVLLLLVDEDGDVKDGKIQQSSGFPRLDKAALVHAKRRWRFTPAQKSGRPVAHWMPFAVDFRLKDAS